MKYIILILLVSLFPYASYTQGLEDPYKEDLNLSEREYNQKYIDRFNSIPELRLAFQQSRELFEKIYFLKKLSKYLDNEEAFRTYIDVINTIPHSTQVDPNWKLRALAIFLLGERGQSLSEDKQLTILKMVEQNFKRERNPRIIIASALTLIKLTQDETNIQSTHRLFNKRTITILLSNKMHSLTYTDNYLCWSLIKIALIHNDPYILYVLKELRKRPFKALVLQEIENAIIFFEKKM